MEQIVIIIIISALEDALYELVKSGVKYIVRKVVDEFGRCRSEIVVEYDSDGDGTNDTEEVLYTIDTVIPDLSEGYCLCNDGDKVGLGYPQYKVLSGIDVAQHYDLFVPDADYPVISGNDNGYLVDWDSDLENDDVLIPMDWDLDGDGLDDWGWLIDDNNDGLPDASPDGPFYPVGSDEYHDIAAQSEEGVSIVVMNPDGTMSIYDNNGNLTEEICDKAYELWVSDNGAMVKEFQYYSVTEAMLFIIAAVTLVGFFVKLFKRKRYI